MTDARLIDEGRLAKNTGLNLLGQVLPAVTAIVTVPYIIHGLGVQRFGILSIVWIFLTYLSLLDLGLGRATIKFVAEALGGRDTELIPKIVWTSLAVQMALGTVGGLALAAGTPLLVGHLFKIPADLIQESKGAFYLLSLSIPFLLGLATLKGVLEANQRFDLVNAVRSTYGTLVFVLPAIGVRLALGLVGILMLLDALIVMTAVLYLVLDLRLYSRLRSLQITGKLLPMLFAYGGWVTISAVLVPVLVYSDRLLIGALLSVGAVAYYTVPYEMVSRLQVIPWSFGTVLFPAFSSLASSETRNVEALYLRSQKYLLLLMGPFTIVILFWAGPILNWWVGADLARKGTAVFQVLALGVLFNGLAQISAHLLDGVGRPDLRAKIFLSYVVPYLVASALLITRIGILGAAVAWTARSGLELALFSIVAFRLLRMSPGLFAKAPLLLILVLLVSLVAVVAAVGTAPVILSTLATSVCVALFAGVMWVRVFDQADKRHLRFLIAGLRLSAHRQGFRP